MRKTIAIVMIGLLIAWTTAQASPAFRHVNAGDISNGVATINSDVTGTDAVMFALAAFPCTEGLTVTSITNDGSPLDKQVADGCLECMTRVELFAEASAATGDVNVVITLSASADGEGVVFVVSGAYQDPPLADFNISVGKGVAGETINTPDGDATIIVVFSDSDTVTISTPSNFVQELNTVLASDVRVAVFSDMDSSEATAALSFSAPVEYIAYALGIDND